MKKIFVGIILFFLMLFPFMVQVKAEPVDAGSIYLQKTCTHKKLCGVKNCVLKTNTSKVTKKTTATGVQSVVFNWKQTSFNCSGYTLKYNPSKTKFYTKYKKRYQNNGGCNFQLYCKVKGKTITLNAEKADGYKENTGKSEGAVDAGNSGAVNDSGNIIDTDSSKNNEERINILTAITTGQKYTSCQQLLSDGVVKILKEIFLIIQIITPILLIIFTMLDFTKAVASSDKDAINKALGKFVKRAAIAAAIFLIPTFVTFMMDISGISDGVCGLS